MAKTTTVVGDFEMPPSFFGRPGTHKINTHRIWKINKLNLTDILRTLYLREAMCYLQMTVDIKKEAVMSLLPGVISYFNGGSVSGVNHHQRGAERIPATRTLKNHLPYPALQRPKRFSKMFYYESLQTYTKEV